MAVELWRVCGSAYIGVVKYIKCIMWFRQLLTDCTCALTISRTVLNRYTYKRVAKGSSDPEFLVKHHQSKKSKQPFPKSQNDHWFHLLLLFHLFVFLIPTTFSSILCKEYKMLNFWDWCVSVFSDPVPEIRMIPKLSASKMPKPKNALYPPQS